LCGKISAAVKNGCDTIIIPADNLTNYYSEVPSNIQSKVKSVQTVANYKELKKIVDNWKN
jgi:ATP-dependent Lon protease